MGRVRAIIKIVGLLHDLTDSQPRAMKQLRSLRAQPIEAGGPGLVELLSHPSHEVRGDAARALGKAGWEPATPRLIECLDDPHPHVVAWSAEALGRIGSRDAVPRLAEVLDHEKDTPRIYAAQALRHINHRSGVPALIRALEDPSRAVFTEAREALEALAQPEDRVALERAASRIGHLRRRKLKRLLSRLREHDAAPA